MFSLNFLAPSFFFCVLLLLLSPFFLYHHILVSMRGKKFLNQSCNSGDPIRTISILYAVIAAALFAAHRALSTHLREEHAESSKNSNPLLPTKLRSRIESTAAAPWKTSPPRIKPSKAICLRRMPVRKALSTTQMLKTVPVF